MSRYFKIPMAIFYLAAGIYHLVNPDFYIKIMPDYIPLHFEMVILSGLAEIILSLLLLIPRTQALAAWGIVAMLIVFLTVHVHMLIHADRYPDLPLLGLWARLIAQGLLIYWAWTYTRPQTRGRRNAEPSS